MEGGLFYRLKFPVAHCNHNNSDTLPAHLQNLSGNSLRHSSVKLSLSVILHLWWRIILNIRRSHLPAGCPHPIFRRVDDDIAEWIFDVVVEIFILWMPL